MHEFDISDQLEISMIMPSIIMIEEPTEEFTEESTVEETVGETNSEAVNESDDASEEISFISKIAPEA